MWSLLLLCKGQISVLCSLLRSSRLSAINVVHGAPDRGLCHGNYRDARRLRLHLTPKGDKKKLQRRFVRTPRVAGEASRAETHKSAAKSRCALGLPSHVARAFLLIISPKWKACFKLRHRQKTHSRHYENSLYESPFTIYVQQSCICVQD